MSLQSVILNDKIPFTLDVSTGSSNILYCNSINEHVFGVAVFEVKDKQLILEYQEENNEKYVKIDVQIGNKVYRQSAFKVVFMKGVLPESTFNPNYTKPVHVEIVQPPAPDIIAETIDMVSEVSSPPPAPLMEQKPARVYEPLQVGGLYEVAINTTIPMILIESGEVENIFFCSTFTDQLFNVGILKTKDAELISEYVVENNEKYVLVDLLFENGDLYHKIKFKIVEVKDQDVPISMFNLNTLNGITKSCVEFTGPAEQLTDMLQELAAPETVFSESTDLILQKKEYAKAIEKARDLERALQVQNNLLIEKQKELQKKSAIVEAATEIETLIWENVQNKLETFKQDFSIEFKQNSKKNLDEYVLDRLKQDLETTADIDDKLKQLIEQAENTVKIKDGIKKYVDKAVDAALREAKKFAATVSEGGGGSVAVQYAQGGTMNGHLTVDGLTVKSGVEFCGDVLPCVTDTYSLGSPSRRWKDLYVSDSSIYLGNVTLSAIGNTFIVPNDTVFTGNATQDGALDVKQSILSAGVDLLDIFASTAAGIQNLSWNPVPYDLAISDGNTVSLTSIKIDFQNFSKNNFLPLSGGNITGSLNIYKDLTVHGNLTALGDSFFVNTIFTTTSALSVINVGKGPALYVYQAAGPYDVASFYDGDGIEVLHVGNAQPGGRGRIGINESYPGVELTVNGAISSNNIIIAANGDSNSWNSVYASTKSNSANWDSVYTTTYTNSAEWESVYSSWNQLSGIYVTTHYLSTNNVLLSAVTVTDNMNVGGTGYFNHVAAASKSFYIPHPSKQGLHLQYGSLESPYHGVRLTGKSTIQTSCTVRLPYYIKDLVHNSEASVQLTNMNHTKCLYVSEINTDENYFVVKRKHNFLNKNRLYDFFWSFTAVRKDIPALQVEI